MLYGIGIGLDRGQDNFGAIFRSFSAEERRRRRGGGGGGGGMEASIVSRFHP